MDGDLRDMGCGYGGERIHCRMPFQCGGLPRIRRGELSFAQAAGEIEEKDKLGRGEKDGGISDEAVEGNGLSEEDPSGTERAS